MICPGGMDTEGYADLASERANMNANIKLATPQQLAPPMVKAVGAGERTHYTEFALRAISFLRALFPVKIDHVINNIEKPIVK
jgi:short-subunit dehydrogenase